MEYVLLISNLKDVNINHFFALETWVVWDMIVKYKDVSFILILTHVEDNGVHRWRKDLASAMLPTFTSKNEMTKYLIETTSKIIKVIDLPSKGWMIDAWSFIRYQPSQHYMSFAQCVKDNLQVKAQNGSFATLVTRDKSRVLYDEKTKQPFDVLFAQECSLHNIPFKIVCFDHMTLREQATVLNETKVMLSCHGAANTNVFLLPQNGHLMEINFRKYWYCDPVCQPHFIGTLPYKCKCDGKLTYRPYFHKADYHNLAHLFGKKYTELPLEDAEGFLDSNPINIKKVFVDADSIMQKVMLAIHE